MKTKPTIKQIIKYWKTQGLEYGLWEDAHEICWRCRNKSSLKRCHIVPESLNGSCHPSNLVLLCRRCHREAPNIADPKFMWVWLENTGGPFYWELRGREEYRKMFGREPFSLLEELLEENKITIESSNDMLKEELRKTKLHFGEGRLNPSTIASIWSKLEEKLLERN